MFSSFKEYIPTVTIVLTLIGFFDLYFYFWLFDIDIYNFLDVVEIIFSFSTIYLYFIGLILALLVFYISLFVALVPFSRNKRFVNGFERLTDANKRMKNSKFAMYARRISAFFLLAMFVAFIIDKVFLPYSPTDEFTVMLTFIGLLVGVSVLIWEYQEEELENTRPSTVVVMLFVLFMLFVITRDYLRFKNVVNGFPSTVVSLTMPDGSVFVSSHINTKQASNSFYFIGATKNFYFFWNRLTNSTRVIPVTEVRQIDLFKVPRIKRDVKEE